MRIFKVAGKVAVAVALLCAFNAALTFALTVYGSKSQVMWTDYSQQEQIDTVFVGTSIAERAFDPQAIDAALGTHSFNMSTPVQVLESMYTSIRTAYEDHGIKRAVVGLGYSNLQEERAPDPGRTYYDERRRVVSLAQAAETDVRLLAEPDNFTGPTSLNWVFPWIHNKVALSPSAILKNVRMKTDGTSVYEAAAASDKSWVYYGKGYGNHRKTLDYNSGSVSLYDDTETYHADFNPERMATLAEMCAYCSERGIELVAVGVPVPDFYLMGYGEKYYEQAAELAAFMREHGAEYYDFNLARPELFDVQATWFADSEHLNRAGALAFSEAFSRLMGERASGRDVSGLFCDAGERQARLDYISALLVDSEGTDGGVSCTARALCGAGVEPVYQVLVERDGAWELVRDWSGEERFTLAPGAHGQWRLRVNVRARGSQAPWERYRILQVMS